MSASFEVVTGDAGSRVVLHVPHASRTIPSEVREGIVLDDEALAEELDAMTDTGADVVARIAADGVARRPWTFANLLSRLVVDPERFPDEREEMAAVGMGAVYTGTHDRGVLRRPDERERRQLVERWFHPYAAALAALVGERVTACGVAVILDVHTYPAEPLPYERHADGARPAVCIGTDAVHTPDRLAILVEREIQAVVGDDVRRDTPFGGTYVPLAAYEARDERVRSVMVEIRRDVVASVGDELGRVLGRVVDEIERTQG